MTITLTINEVNLNTKEDSKIFHQVQLPQLPAL